VWVVALAVLVVRLDVDHHQTLLNLGFWQEAFNLKVGEHAPTYHSLSLSFAISSTHPLCSAMWRGNLFFVY
jgi:hypothetical protein